MIRNAFNEIKLFIFFNQIFDWPTKGGVAELRVLSITSANSSDPIRPLRCVCLFKLYGKDKKKQQLHHESQSSSSLCSTVGELISSMLLSCCLTLIC